MATITVGYAFTAQTRTCLEFAALTQGSVTSSCRCAWNTALAPLYVQLTARGHGDASATAYVTVYYKWANLTTSASSTALLDKAKANMANWGAAMSFEMNSVSTVVQSAVIPVQGKHLAVALQNESSGTVSNMSVVAVGIHLKVI